MLLSSLCVCFGQLCWKLAAQSSAALLVTGFALYGAGAALMLIAYKFGDLSVLQPVLSMNYAFTLVLGCLFLHESLTPRKLAGVALVTAGVVLIGRSAD